MRKKGVSKDIEQTTSKREKGQCQKTQKGERMGEKGRAVGGVETPQHNGRKRGYTSNR